MSAWTLATVGSTTVSMSLVTSLHFALSVVVPEAVELPPILDRRSCKSLLVVLHSIAGASRFSGFLRY